MYICNEMKCQVKCVQKGREESSATDVSLSTLLLQKAATGEIYCFYFLSIGFQRDWYRYSFVRLKKEKLYMRPLWDSKVIENGHNFDSNSITTKNNFLKLLERNSFVK